MKKIIATVAIGIIVCVWIYFLRGKTTIKSIQQGDLVSIQYEATLPDGRIFSNSDQETIIIGENALPWIDNQLIGQHSGDMITITVPATQGYGIYYDPNKLQRTPIYTLTQAGITAQIWTFILLGWTRYYIKSIENDVVTLDINPEHTRQDLKYTITILWITKKSQ